MYIVFSDNKCFTVRSRGMANLIATQIKGVVVKVKNAKK